MKKLTSWDVVYIYRRLLEIIKKDISRNNVEVALSELAFVCKWKYIYNFDYSSVEIDSCISKIRNKILEDIDLSKSKRNNILMLDSFAYDNRGLTQQYLRAFKSLGYNLLFINTQSELHMQSDVRRELSLYPNAKAVFLGQEVPFNEKLRLIRNEIELFAPSKIFLHFAPWDLIPPMISDACKGVVRYNVNLTDHAFWPGVSFVDYNIEFRQFGRTIDIEKRGFEEKQLLNLPFYPIQPIACPFMGFPPMPSDAIKIFAGGNFYKMFGGDDIFFKMLDKLLDISCKVYVLIAGDGNRQVMNKKLGLLKHRERVVLLGNRHDISEVFKHIDIFLGTLPFCGGLMTQYASYYEKPILAVCPQGDPNNDISQLVNHFGNTVNVCRDLESMIDYAAQLIEDRNYRITEGSRAKLSMMNDVKFVSILKGYLEDSPSTQFKHWGRDSISYGRLFDDAISRENKYTASSRIELWRRYRYKMFTRFPRCIALTISIVIELAVNKVYKVVC